MVNTLIVKLISRMKFNFYTIAFYSAINYFNFQNSITFALYWFHRDFVSGD